MDNEKILYYGDELHDALTRRVMLAPLTEREPGITIEDAYRIQERMVSHRLDAGESIIGKKVGALTVRDFSELGDAVEQDSIVVGVIAVPSASAQAVTDGLVEAGVTVIFNYTEQLLQVPPEVTVHASSPAVDLLYALYFYLS